MNDKKRVQVNGIRVQYGIGNRVHDYEAEAIHKAASLIFRETGARSYDLKISKKSIDARREISFVYTVCAEIERGAKIKDSSDIKEFSEPDITVGCGSQKLSARPVIVGFGPAGIFAGLLLAEYGYAPLIVERGSSVGDRVRAVERFINDGILDTNTNIQFGAGGAGTFSDGKLTTRINDPMIAYVLRTLNKLGAPDDILYKAKPHIGTDILRDVVQNAERRICELGGEIRFNTAASHIGGGSVKINGEDEKYGVLILATGHSARDTYTELMNSGFAVEPKPFSVGVRAEHLQSDIDKAMFGAHAGDEMLGHAEYQLSYRCDAGSCYTFCMCPGGVVVPSASEEFGVVTNGMSTRARDGVNANAAVCVSVNPADYGSTPQKAIDFQRGIERKAYEYGGRNYYAPMQTFGDLEDNKSGTLYTKIIPSYRGGKVTPCDFNMIFPTFVTDMLRVGIKNFGTKIQGYDERCVPLTGVETRTSSPVRILRNDELEVVGQGGIYPCGEGAGYAGGIVSAAVDGLRVAAKIISKYAPESTGEVR